MIIAPASVSKLVIYPLTFFNNDQKIIITGIDAIRAETIILLKGSII